MEDVMVTCEDDSMEEDEEEQEVQIIATKDEGKKQPAATRCAPASAKKSGEPARGKPEPPRAAPTPQPEADPVDSEDEMEEEEEAAAEQPDQCSKRQNQATKKLPADEKRGRAYHEINEEAFFDRNDKIPAYNNILDGVKDELVCLDASTCDLQFKMDKERYGGRPLLYSIFPFLWSGSKATHGVKKGKVYFEIKRTDNLPLKEGYTEFPLLRVGWSVARSGPQLGEDDLSFAYDSRGLKATSGRFETYGKSFREYDLIGCYADLDGDSVEISFSKNGEDLGQAFHFNKSSLGDHALLPHIICKGCSFQVNFGQKLKPWHKPSEGFRFLHDLKSEDMIRTPVPPRSKKACEMLMMVGFPASGKTTWALKHIQENPDKNYIHLSVDRFISQVKTVGLDEPEYNNKVLDQHIKMATKCLRRALPIAGSRKANYIIDQCSMDRNAQQWKLLCFTGFTCKAVLLVPEEEEWERRLEERRKEGEIYPESVLVRMKANLWVPKMNKTTLSEIITPELWKTGSQKYLFKLKMEAKVNPLNPRKGIKFTPKATSKKNVQDSRPHPYRAPVPLMSSWRPRAGGFQNSRALSPPRQDRFFGRNNDLPENRQGFQNSRALSPPRQDRFFGRNNDLPENRPGFQNSRVLSPPRQDRFFGRNNDLPENRLGFQNSRALSPPRQDRFFGRNNDLPENRQGFQNSRALSPPRPNTLFGRINDLLENRPGFQNSRALSPPRQDRLFGRNNDLPENRPGFQNSRVLSPPRQDRFFGRNHDLPENRPFLQDFDGRMPDRANDWFRSL